MPVMRALAFQYLCEHKTIYLGDDELIVGERGPEPKAVPTYPELTCHSLEDLRHPRLAAEDQLRRPRGVPRGLRGRRSSPTGAAAACGTRSSPRCRTSGIEAYEAGIFTEFMEQRAPGHTVLDDKIYRQGLARLQTRRSRTLVDGLDFAERSRRVRQARAAAGDGHRLRRGHPVRRAARRAGRGDGRARDGSDGAGANWRRSPPCAGTCPRMPARFPRGAAVLLVLPPGGDHRTERLGRLQPRAPGPAPVAVLRAGLQTARSPAKRPRSCSSASSSSSTTTRRRPRSASRPPRAAPTPTLPTSTSAGCCPTVRTGRTK